MAVQVKFQMREACRLLVACCILGSWSASADAQGEPTASPDERPAEIDACALLSPAAVSEATGFPANAGIRRDAGYESNGSYSSSCVWLLERENADASQNAALGGRSFVILNVMRWPAGSGLADSFLQAFRDAADRGEIPREPVPRDYGDAALWWGDGLAVRIDDVSFGISVVLPGSSPARPGDFEERLAAEILLRLERSTD